MDWLSAKENKIPIGKMIKSVSDFLVEYCGPFFDLIIFVVDSLFNGTVFLLTVIPAVAFIALVSALSYFLQRSLKLTLFILAAQLLILNLGYWEASMETVALIIWTTVLCMLIGVPIGIAAAHRARVWTALNPVLDLMQTIPVFVYLIPAITLLGLGATPGVFATIIFVLPAPIRLTYLGVSSVPTQLIEAAESFGATKKQLLWKVEIPYAMPSIMAGLTQTIMLSLSMIVIASMVAAPGLGVDVLRSISQYNEVKGYESGLAIALIAIMLDRMLKRRKKEGK